MKKRVFIYIHQCALRGGVEKVFHNILHNLPEEKYKITVVSKVAYLADDLDLQIYPKYVKRRWLYYDELSSGGVKRFFQKMHNRIMPRVYPKLLRLWRFDTAIAAQEGEYAQFVQQHIRAKRSLLWIHNDLRICHWTQMHFSAPEKEGECYRKFDQVICVSEAVSQSMNAVFGKMDNLKVCYNPIDTAEIDRKIVLFTPERDEKPQLVAVGRLAHQKGFDRLLNICRRLNDEGFAYNLWIVGEGEEREALERKITQNMLTNVKLLGNQSNPFAYMASADWVVCTSRHEGFNMVLHEAVWCGTPIITMDNAGARELLGDSEYGIVTQNAEDDFYRHLKAVLSNPAIREEYARKVQQRRVFISLEERMEAVEKLL